MGSGALIDIGLPLSLFLIMVGMGMTLAPKISAKLLSPRVAPSMVWFARFFCCR